MACQAPLSIGFSRQEYWSGLPIPSPVFVTDVNKKNAFLQIRGDIDTSIYICVGFPGSSAVKRILLLMQETQELWVRYLGWEIPWRRDWQSTPVFLPGESHGQRSLAGYGPLGHKESDRTE